MAKRGYRGSHPYDDMKVEKTSNKISNLSKITDEYNKVGSKYKYQYIIDRGGAFDPQATGAVLEWDGVATNNETVTIVSTDGTSKAYVAKSAGADLTVDPCQYWGAAAAAAATSLKACIEAPDIQAVAATCTVTMDTITNIVGGDTVGLTDFNGTTHTFTFVLTDNVTTGNNVGIAAAIANSNDVGDAAVQLCESIEDPSSTSYATLFCDNVAGVVTVRQAFKGTAGNQSIVTDDLTGASGLTAWAGGGNLVQPGHSGKISADNSVSAKLTLTQDEPGPDGNTTIVISDGEPAGGDNVLTFIDG